MSTVIVVILTIFGILVVIPVLLLGIVSYIYVISGYSSAYLSERINARFHGNYVRIKPCKIGNNFFSVYNVKEITIMGMKLYGHLYDQMVDLQFTVEDIVDKITSFQLENYYIAQDSLQSQINAFCDNFRELGRMLANSEIINGDAVNDIIKKIFDDNRVILAELHSFNKYLDNYINVHRDLLFNTHSSEGEKILATHPEPVTEDVPVEK